jgi:hypothetical protein
MIPNGMANLNSVGDGSFFKWKDMTIAMDTTARKVPNLSHERKASCGMSENEGWDASWTQLGKHSLRSLAQ